MNISLAPIQGMTSFEYRNEYNRLFGNIDAYYAPFISPTNIQETHPNFFDDVQPTVNTCHVIPQLLGNNGDDFRRYAKTISGMGYQEINWNIGCSFFVVTKKRKGAGILAYPDMIRSILDEVCKDNNYKLSVKMRLGMNSSDEGIKVIEALNDYPINNVIVHARTGIQKYSGQADLDAFETLYNQCNHTMTYNGDIFTIDDYNKLIDRFPKLENIMLGRGGLNDPFLASEIKGIHNKDKIELIQAFHQYLYKFYEIKTSRELRLLNKMKEFWGYTHVHLDPTHEHIKEIRQCQTTKEYLASVDKIFKNQWL